MTDATMKTALGTLVLIGCGLAAAAGAQDAPDPAAAARGKIIYVRYCASCHGAAGQGDGVLAPDLRVPPTDLTRLAAQASGRFPFEDVRRSIDGRKTVRGHGSADMPVWGEVFPRASGTDSPDTESAISRLTHYIWSIQKK
jgi:mono/diheme cytochrome c family protein